MLNNTHKCVKFKYLYQHTKSVLTQHTIFNSVVKCQLPVSQTDIVLNWPVIPSCSQHAINLSYSQQKILVHTHIHNASIRIHNSYTCTLISTYTQANHKVLCSMIHMFAYKLPHIILIEVYRHIHTYTCTPRHSDIHTTHLHMYICEHTSTIPHLT